MTSPNRPDFDTLWDYADPATTEQKFRALLPQAQAPGDAAYLAQLLSQIARTQGLQRQFHAAHATLDQVEALLATHDPPLARVRYLLERGRVYNSSDQPQRAGALFQEAFELASKHRLDVHAIDAAHMLAIAAPDPAVQLEWNHRAMNLAETSGDERARRWRASLYNNIGWTHFQRQEYDRALEVFQKAVALRAEAQQPRELRIARYCVAKTWRMQGRLEEALRLSRELADDAQRAGQMDGYLLEELAECLLAGGRGQDAKPHFARAYDELSKDPWLSANEPQRLQRLRELGQ